jgi:prepilin-type N-terminal cleavage/methylation domain-containing protein
MKKFISKVKKATKDFFINKSAFSLVELIVVIAIMAVMAAVLAPALLGYVERSRAQKDDSAMGEVTNAIQLSLADQNVYDELLPYAVKGNFSCYADGDTSTNIDANKTITKAPDYWLFTDEARKLDETPYKPAGSMRGVTITLKPNGSAEYILKDGIINQTGDSSTAKGTITGKTLNDAPEVYNRLRSTVGDTIKVSSQTYRNSTYTIFISMGTTGGNQADKQDAIKVYGQYNGTNLPEVMTATGSATQDKGNAGTGGSEQPTPPAETITFKINGNPYTNSYPSNFGVTTDFESVNNMTWENWIDSNYNTVKFFVHNDGYVGSLSYGMEATFEGLMLNGSPVHGADLIQANATYYIECYYSAETPYESVTFSIEFRDYTDYYMTGNESDKKVDIQTYTLDNSGNRDLSWESWINTNPQLSNLPNFNNLRFGINSGDVVIYNAAAPNTSIEHVGYRGIYLIDPSFPFIIVTSDGGNTFSAMV